MAYIGAGSPELRAIVKALGLDGTNVVGFELKARVGEVLTMTVEYMPEAADVDSGQLLKTFRVCRLEEVSEDPPLDGDAFPFPEEAE